MSRTVLLSGSDTGLKAHLASVFESRGWNPLLSQERITPFSARSLILRGVKEHASIESVLIILGLKDEERVFHEVPAAVIETMVDTHTKGILYILKEVIPLFIRQGQGTISFILQQAGTDSENTVNAYFTGGVKALAESMFASYQHYSFIINGFEASPGAVEPFSDFILDTLDGDGGTIHGKWYRYSDKTGFFRSLNLPGLGR